MNQYEFQLIENAINATLGASYAHMMNVNVGRNQLPDLFVVEIAVDPPTENLGYVCDHFGTVDGPYKLVDAKTVVHDENKKE